MKPYESYKRTTIPWMETIPSHWSEIRGKNLYYKENRPALDEDDVVTCFRDGQVTLRKNRRMSGFTESIKEIGYQHIEKGDLVIHVMDAFAGAVGVADSSGKGTPVYSVCTAKVDISNFYYAHIVRQMALSGFIQSLYRGIRERSSDFRFDVFGTQMLPVPPRTEQDQIVRFLDWKLSKINKLIKAKKKQIKLLNEQKQAIINKAVIKGLDDSVTTKYSGGEWIGDIPADWRKIKLGKIAKIILSGLDKKSYEGQQSVSLCNYVDVYKNDYISENIAFMKATASESERQSLKLFQDDVVITKDSESWDDIGVAAYVPQNIVDLHCAYHLAILRTKKEILLGEYLFYLFQSQYVQVQHKIKAKGVTRFALGYQPIHDTVLFVPSISEQEAIISKLKFDCHIQDASISIIKKKIDFLLEYKTSLISSVVTGKVDVCDVVVPDFEIEDEVLKDELGAFSDEVEASEVDG